VSIIGTRRWGKTYYFYDVMKKLIQQGKEKNELLYVNFEDERILPFDVKDFDSLPEAYFELFPENKGKTVYLFLDEIQNVRNWEIAVRNLTSPF
jgi:Predicted ATPase (AAA+ superfamily)